MLFHATQHIRGTASMADVFISYSKKDIHVAQALARVLVGHGFSVWYDGDISSGDDFREEIARELENAAAVLVIWTRHAASSDWVISEAQRAKRLSKLVQVRVSDFPIEAIPQPFDILHTVETGAEPEIIRAVAKKLSNNQIARIGAARRINQPDAALSEQTSSPRQSLNIVRRPLRCYGRDPDVERLVATLLHIPAENTGHTGFLARLRRQVAFNRRSLPAAKIIIYGGPGIGKTTLSRAAACDPRIEKSILDRRFFISLEDKYTLRAFREAVGSALNSRMDAAGSFPTLAEILADLPKVPTLLILDNLETPLEACRGDIENELTAFDAHPHIALLATQRGREIPAALIWTLSYEIKALDETSSIALFLDIASSISKEDPHLQPLIQAMGGVPLTIELVAHETAKFSAVEAVWNEWLRIGTALARRRGAASAKLSSFDYSLELSLNSPNRLPNSLVMLRLIASLEGGADISLCESVFGSQCFAIVRDLLGAGLVYQRGTRIDSLPPIREYAARRLSLDHDQWRTVVEYFLEKARWFASDADPAENASISRFLIADQVNIQRWLYAAFHTIEVNRFYHLVNGLIGFLSRAAALATQPDSLAPATIRLHRLLEGFFTYHALMAFKRRRYVVGVAYSYCKELAERAVLNTMLESIQTTINELNSMSNDVGISDREKMQAFAKDVQQELDFVKAGGDAEGLAKTLRVLDEAAKKTIDEIDAEEFRIATAAAPAGSSAFLLEATLAMYWATARGKSEAAIDGAYSESLATGVDAATWQASADPVRVDDHVDVFCDYAAQSQFSEMSDILNLASASHCEPDAEAEVRNEAYSWIARAAALGEARAIAELAALPVRIEVARLEQAGDHAGELVLRRNLVDLVERRETLENGAPGVKTATQLGHLAWNALLIGDYAAALSASERAEQLAPGERWLSSNRAHALMFLGRTDEAMTLYQHYRGTVSGKDDARTWEDIIRDDFSKLRAAGITHSQMDHVEEFVGGPLQAGPAQLPVENELIEYARNVLALKRDINRLVADVGAATDVRDQLAAMARLHPKAVEFITQAFVKRGEALLDDETKTDRIHYGKALDLFLEAASWGRQERVQRPVLARAIVGLGKAQFRCEQYAEAISSLQEARQLGRKDTDDWLWWGTNHLGFQQANNGSVVEGILTTWSNLLDMSDAASAAITTAELKTNSIPWLVIGQQYGELRNAEHAARCTRCDALASHPYDPLRIAPGVALQAIDAGAAVTACTEALETDPTEPRLRYQRARAHRRAGDIAAAANDGTGAAASFAAALEDFQVAIAAGYPAAFAAMASMLEDGLGIAVNPQRSGELHVETLNRVLFTCAVPVVRCLLRQESKYNATEVRKVVSALLSWSAALGNGEAHALMRSLAAQKVIVPDEKPAAGFDDLPPWLQTHADGRAGLLAS